MFTSPFLGFLEKLYLRIIWVFSRCQSALLFLLRITWGHQFFLAGLKKFHGMEGVIQLFDSLHIPFPHLAAPLVATLEVVGGTALVLGLGSRFFAFLLAIVLFIAYGTAHVHVFKGFHFVMDPSLLVKEAPFPFLLTCLFVLAFGPGKVSLDGWLKRWREQKQKYG